MLSLWHIYSRLMSFAIEDDTKMAKEEFSRLSKRVMEGSISEESLLKTSGNSDFKGSTNVQSDTILFVTLLLLGY